MTITKEITLKHKIGQMLLVGFKGTELQPTDLIVEAILEQQIGGVILFDYNYQTKIYDHNISDPAQLKYLTQQLQNYNKNNMHPLLISIDYEGGKVNRLKEKYGFPPALSAAEIGLGTYEKAAHYAYEMAKTLKEMGINLNFAPVLDVNINPDNPVIGKIDRSFSNNPQKVIHYAELFSKAHQDQGILFAYKHFPGHGSSTSDSHLGFVDVTETWQELELEPYYTLLPQFSDCAMVMIAHVVHYGLDNKGYPASLSAAMTQKLLRETLGFNGVVVTDDLQMKAITDQYGLKEALRLAINAGADILVFGNQLVASYQDPKQLVEMIYADVLSGEISLSRIEESYQRICQLKDKSIVSSH